MKHATAQRGASAVLIAASMLLLLGFAAIAVDIGAAKNERRLDQNSADASVLAAALDLGFARSTQTAVDSVVDLVNTNLRNVTPQEWEDCVDSQAFAVTAADLGLTPGTECISFDTFEQVRVRVPNQDTATTFGRILGATQLRTSAFAEASDKQFPGLGNPPPFVVLETNGAGDQICLRTSSSGPPVPVQVSGNGIDTPHDPVDMPTGLPDPCDESTYDPASEFFGALDTIVYFNPDTSAITCTSNLVEFAIAAGIDHPVGDFGQTYSPPDPRALEEGTGCNAAPENGPNTFQLDTGMTPQELRCGLLSTRSGTCSTAVPGPGSSVVTPRLQTGSFVGTNGDPRFVGEEMDNAALWEFMVPSSEKPSPNWPTTCLALRSQVESPTPFKVWDYYDYKDLLRECLNDWKNDDPLFTVEILETPRFAFIPLLAESSLDPSDPDGPSSCLLNASNQCVHINDFAPVYMQTLYTLIQGGNGGTCDPGGSTQRWGRHDAGNDEDCGKANDFVDRMSAWLLDCGMLPTDVCTSRPGPPTPGGELDPEIELTR